MISVCMASYNGEKYIREQISSILAQINQDDELIISDDGSSDCTLEIIKSFNDNRIKLLNHKKKNSYSYSKYFKNFYLVSKNFENALQCAKGDFIFLSDQDDVWLENRVNKVLEKLKEYDTVMCNFITIDSKGTIIKNPYFSSDPVGGSVFKNIVKSGFLGCCMAFKRDVLNYVLPFPEKLIYHDGWIGCISLKKFSFKYIEEPLHYYRRTSENVSSMTIKSKNPFIYKLSYRVDFMIKFICHIIKKTHN